MTRNWAEGMAHLAGCLTVARTQRTPSNLCSVHQASADRFRMKSGDTSSEERRVMSRQKEERDGTLEEEAKEEEVSTQLSEPLHYSPTETTEALCGMGTATSSLFSRLLLTAPP